MASLIRNTTFATLEIRMRKSKKQDHIKHGWAEEPFHALYNFRHFPSREARELQKYKNNQVWIVEAVNWTLTDKKKVRFKKYMVCGLSQAISFAVRLEINSKELAEE